MMNKLLINKMVVLLGVVGCWPQNALPTTPKFRSQERSLLSILVPSRMIDRLSSSQNKAKDFGGGNLPQLTPKTPPEFFFAIAHADRIIARIKPPFIDYVFSKVQADLKGYRIATDRAVCRRRPWSKPQVILDCVKCG